MRGRGKNCIQFPIAIATCLGGFTCRPSLYGARQLAIRRPGRARYIYFTRLAFGILLKTINLPILPTLSNSGGMMKPNWVDFKVVKEHVTMRMALDHYDIKSLRKKGSELYGQCPIHKGKSEDSFTVNTEKNCF